MSFTIDIPALALLEAEFLVLRRIGGLPEYHGIQWSSLFKHLLRRRLGLPEPVPEGFVPRMGLLPAYPPSQSVVPGVSLFLRMVLPLPMPEVMQGVLEEFNRESFTNGQFQPGRTIRLESIRDCVGGEEILPRSGPSSWDRIIPLGLQALEPEIHQLERMEEFSLILDSPLRLPRPEGTAHDGHRFFDSAYAADPSAIGHLISRLRQRGDLRASADIQQDNRTSGLRIADAKLDWLDIPYGRASRKVLGGVVGMLRIIGRPLPQEALSLSLGQYVGAGKNTAFGFGFYHIPEVDVARQVIWREGRPSPEPVPKSTIAPPPAQETVTEEMRTTSWRPALGESQLAGMSVYLTSTCRNATLRGRTLVIEHSEGERRIPWDRVGRLVLVGRPAVPPAILHRAARASIPVSFLDALGRLVGLLQTPSPVSAQLRLRQEESLADENWRLKTAREMIAAKIHNCRVILRRNNADEPRLGGMEENAARALSLDSLRGIEGAAANAFFHKFAGLVDPFSFPGRRYRPSTDPVNAMLSFGYSLLANRLGSALAACDIDPRLGIFHQGRGRHFALASDLLEQFRHVSERLVLALIHRREVTPGDFNMSDSGPCRGKPGVIGLMIRRMEETLARERILADNGEGEGKTRSDLNGFLDRAATQLIEVFQRRRPYDAFRIR